MSGETGMKYQSLYGDHMAVYLPTDAKDVSLIREVPDNQEVWTHADTDQSIIIEILEYVQQPDQQAVQYHFDDIASSNESEHPEVLTVETVPKEQVALTQCDSVYYLTGKQHVAKFNEAVKNVIHIHMVLFRLSEFETDILVHFNDPVNIDPESSSHAPVATGVQPWTPAHFKQVIQTLKILNTGLFGGE